MTTIIRRDYRRGTKTGVKGKDTKEGRKRERKREKAASEVNVVKRAKQLIRREKKYESMLDDASNTNAYDKLNDELEHAGDTENTRRIFKK